MPEARGDVDWQLVKETARLLQIQQLGPGWPGRELAIIIVVAALTAGAASTFAGFCRQRVGPGAPWPLPAATAATATTAAAAGYRRWTGQHHCHRVLTAMAGNAAVNV